MSGPDRRRRFLDRVAECVCRDRQATHGEAEDSFDRIARLASVVLEHKLREPFDQADVALFMVCLKLGRLSHDPRQLDSVVDLAGYATCLGGIVLQEQEGET